MKPIRPGCLGPHEHNHGSIRAGRFTAHHFRSIRPESAMSAPAGNGATDIVAIEVGGDDSPLTSVSQRSTHRCHQYPTPTMGRSRAMYTSSSRTSASRERSPGPDHHSHPPPGSRYRACRALRSRMAHINPVEHTIQLMRIGSTSSPHERRGGSRDDGAASNLRLVKRPCPISSPI